MEAAGIKSVSNRAPRKSKGSTTGGTTPSSASATGSIGHVPSPYQTPTSQTSYTPYMFDPNQHYPGYLPPPPMQMMQSAGNSRVPSPVNAQASGSTVPQPQQQFYPQPFPPYSYPSAMPHLPHQAYRHFPGMQNPYAPHMYPEQYMQPFPTHSRDGSYGGMVFPGAHGPMANGYPNRNQTTTPISQDQEESKVGELPLSAYTRAHRPMSPAGLMEEEDGVHRSGGPRRTPPPHDLMSPGIDLSNMNRSVHPGIIHPSYGYHQQSPHQHMGYYGTPQSSHVLRHHASALSQRASISSLSDGSGGAEGSQKGEHRSGRADK